MATRTPRLTAEQRHQLREADQYLAVLRARRAEAVEAGGVLVWLGHRWELKRFDARIAHFEGVRAEVLGVTA